MKFSSRTLQYYSLTVSHEKDAHQEVFNVTYSLLPMARYVTGMRNVNVTHYLLVNIMRL
jgi:hypothetical protein